MPEVAETCFSFLHMEMVQMALGTDTAAATTSELQHAGRKLEAIGFEVGQRLAERYTKDRARFADTLEIIKFICKDFWFEIYRKQIDKLQTNNRGIYMLQDNKHRLLSRSSPSVERQANAKQVGLLHVKFPSGLIRGALHALGVNASVGVEVVDRDKELDRLCACQFTIKIQPSDGAKS